MATPARTHSSIEMAALAAGKHVLVEKPMADSRDDAVRMIEAARDRDLVLMADHTYCYTPVVTRIAELIADGVLGEILFIDSVRINLGLVQPDVDVFWDLAPHDLSILDYVLPGGLRPRGVAAHGADPLGTGKACVGYLTMPLPGGAIAHAHVNWLSPTKIRQMVIGGTRRTLVWTISTRSSGSPSTTAASTSRPLTSPTASVPRPRSRTGSATCTRHRCRSGRRWRRW